MSVFTIGYAGIKFSSFIDTLKARNISYLIDVRSVAKSQYFSVFNDLNIQNELHKNGIEYLHFKNEFGARQNNLNFYTNGILDFEKFSKSEQFKSGLEQINNFISKGKNVCLMCAEIDPINCHRAILCARELNNRGIKVEHIIAKRNGEILIENHSGLEKRLLELYKTDGLNIAYINQNLKIGYKHD
jgi:uncharacterized protein (DUF488 family)